MNFHLTYSYSAVKILRVPNIGDKLNCSVKEVLFKSHLSSSISEDLYSVENLLSPTFLKKNSIKL